MSIPNIANTTQADIDLLRAAKKRIEDRENWCTGYYAKDSEGLGTGSWEDACQFCAKGSVMAESYFTQVNGRIAELILDQAAQELYGDYDADGYHGVVFVNDELREHSAVMKVYDRAIEMGEALGGTGSIG